MNDLRRHGVTLHLALNADRQPIPDVPAIYLVAPSDEAVARVVQDAAAGLYDSTYLALSTHLPRPLLEKLAAGARPPCTGRCCCNAGQPPRPLARLGLCCPARPPALKACANDAAQHAHTHASTATTTTRAHAPTPPPTPSRAGVVASGSAARLARVLDCHLAFTCLEADLFSLGLPRAYVDLNDPAATDAQIEVGTAGVWAGLVVV